jgi:hypothetical protein
MVTKPLLARLSAATVLALCMMALSGVARSKGSLLQPDKLVIVSTSDVKGKLIPCG